MKIQHLIGTALTCLSLQLTTLHAMVPELKPVVAYAGVFDARYGGYFTGSTITPGFKGQIALIGVDVEDNGTGNGKNKVIIQKYPDASNNQFKTAFSNNDLLQKVIIQIIKPETGQPVPKTFKIYSLKNAYIKSIGAVDGYEVITIIAETIDVENI